ncbi:unnamed protein product [Sphenostylis stenocarpa]|uniref:TFIID subunit TAF5 NTD2 domain-containing protein n=1 Tax=Sphenostylis stenocarpa TaxID=92480 RepID=A0AA86SWU2_9FABA|nr:unnamed protein product [Sphenostylis stenocarpa]
MDEDQIEGCVSGYLKQKGFPQNDDQLQISNSDSSLQPDTLTRAQLDRGSARYHDGYGRLRSWAYRSLESYKHELMRVLYPVFIHCFMDLVAKGHLHEVNLLDFWQYSYELLWQHLHSMQSTTIIGIINEHINFQVTAGQPSSISDDPEAVTVSGSIQNAANQINQKEILWGWGIAEPIHTPFSSCDLSWTVTSSLTNLIKYVDSNVDSMFEDSIEDHIDKAGALLSRTEKGEGEGKEIDNDESKKRSIDVGKQGNSVKKVKKDKVSSATGKNAKPEANTISAAPRIKPELPLPTVSTDVELSILEDLRNRVQLSSVALPSVNFYTFVNTHNGLSCSSISHDGSLLAGGFSDSSLKVWDMAKIEQQSTTFFLQGGNDTSQNEQIIGQNSGRRQYTLFQGHSGPVYAATFSPAGDFLLSSSADKTIRLWSTKLNANLVCYKGHNYPIWDVQFSPAGHYFASCSHDRTARIWSMDKTKPLRIMAGHLSDVDWPADAEWSLCIPSSLDSSRAHISGIRRANAWHLGEVDIFGLRRGCRAVAMLLKKTKKTVILGLSETCVQWHSNCNYIATGSSDKTVRLWDVQSGECVRVFIGHRSMILSLAMSPDGRHMASGDEDGTIMMWDLSSGCCVTPLVGHTSCVWSLAFSCEGSLLASGSADCTVKFWDVATGIKVPRNEEKSGNTNRQRSLKSLPTKSASVYSLQFSRRNLLFAAGALAKSAC